MSGDASESGGKAAKVLAHRPTDGDGDALERFKEKCNAENMVIQIK